MEIYVKVTCLAIKERASMSQVFCVPEVVGSLDPSIVKLRHFDYLNPD